MSISKRRVVEQYWSGVATRLQAEVEVFNRLIGHAGEQGRQKEVALVSILERLLPRRVGLGSGLLIDSTGGRSKQSDAVLFDDGDQPKILA